MTIMENKMKSPLNDILHPHTGKDLLSFFAQNRPRLLESANSAIISQLLNWRDIENLLAMSRYENPGIRLVRNGKELESEAYCFPQYNFGGTASPLVDRRRLLHCFRDGYTIVYDDFEAKHEAILALSQDMEETFRDCCSCHLYVSAGTEPGLSAHWDDHDVLVLQIIGSKSWKLWNPGIPYPIRDFQRHSPGEKGVPFADIELVAGQALVLPRGWWHDPRPRNELSVHISVAISRRTGLNYLQWLTTISSRCELFRRNIDYGGDGHATASYSKSLRDELISFITKNTPNDFLTAFRSGLYCRPQFSLPWDFEADRGNELAGKRVKWALSPVQTVSDDSHTISVRCLDLTLEFPSVAREFVSRLLDREWHATSHLYASVAKISTFDSFAQVLKDLFVEGVILLADEGEDLK